MMLIVLVVVLVTAGVYLLLDDDPVRLVLGAGLLGHGAVTALLTVLRPGRPPIVGVGEGAVADPIPQALSLTAIVIAFGVTAFLLAYTRAVHRGEGDRHDHRPAEPVSQASPSDSERSHADRDEVRV